MWITCGNPSYSTCQILWGKGGAVVVGSGGGGYAGYGISIAALYRLSNYTTGSDGTFIHSRLTAIAAGHRHIVGPIPQKCKETLMWLSLMWFILVLFVCWNLFCTIANHRIKCVTETKNVSVLFYKKSWINNIWQISQPYSRRGV